MTETRESPKDTRCSQTLLGLGQGNPLGTHFPTNLLNLSIKNRWKRDPHEDSGCPAGVPASLPCRPHCPHLSPNSLLSFILLPSGHSPGDCVLLPPSWAQSPQSPVAISTAHRVTWAHTGPPSTPGTEGQSNQAQAGRIVQCGYSESKSTSFYDQP